MAVSYKDLWRFLWPFLRKQKWSFGSVYVLDSLAWPLDVLTWPLILRFAIDTFSAYDSNRMAALKPLTPILVGAISLVVFVEVSSRLMGFILAHACPTLQARIRMKMFDHVSHHSPRYFNERFAGNLANKITDMTNQVDLILHQLFWPLVPAISTCILGAIFLWFVKPIFALLLFVWTVVHVAICIIFAKPADSYEILHSEVRSGLLGKIVDSLTNNFAVNLFYRFKFEQKIIRPAQEAERKSNQRAKRYVELMKTYLSIFYFVTVILGIFGLMVYFWFHNMISTGEVTQVFTTLWGFSMTLWAVGNSFPILFHSFGTLKQAYSVLKDPQDLGDKPRAEPLKVTEGEIIFDNVSFSYGEKKLFVNKHVHIRGGEKVGLVGYTGAGKSTFVNLILRFFPLDEGEIEIDGQQIKNVSLESIRRQIALIPQDPILFHRTLKENIHYGNPDATEEEVMNAARLAHCDEFIQRIPNEYEARVGERGTKLSGGEKQRIAIARAILADAPILILDEATSSLDSVTEKFIQESLEKIMENRTTIVIAHRLSTLAQMDRLLIFDKGAIVEEGDHNTLLAKKGLYAHMWNMQVGGFLPDQD